jgi:hypothetical protein
MAARAHPRSSCNRNTKLFNFTINLNTSRELKGTDRPHHGLGASGEITSQVSVVLKVMELWT